MEQLFSQDPLVGSGADREKVEEHMLALQIIDVAKAICPAMYHDVRRRQQGPFDAKQAGEVGEIVAATAYKVVTSSQGLAKAHMDKQREARRGNILET